MAQIGRPGLSDDRKDEFWPQGPRRVAVVTSPVHTRRACAKFEKLGSFVTCVPAREYEAATIAPARAPDRLAALREYLCEALGTVKYRSAGGWSDRLIISGTNPAGGRQIS